VSRAAQESGFTLLEVLIACTLILTAVAAFAHLAAAGVTRANAARGAASSLALAQGRLEELRSAIFSYDPAGTPVSDPVLVESPPDALAIDRAGWVDATDRFGQPVADGDVGRAAYRRRWSIARFDAARDDTLVLTVCVRSVVSASAAGSGLPDACASSLLTRKP
jgi:Tfp pilus assembly protein PilV